MTSALEFSDNFDLCIDSAIESLRHAELDRAYDLIVKAICMNPDSPEPHNLLGIWYEFTDDGDKARRHYRAAYSLDPTFKPSCKNLERICTLFDRSKPRTIDYGNEPDEIVCLSKNDRKRKA